jgi:hypothetical protein
MHTAAGATNQSHKNKEYLSQFRFHCRLPRIEVCVLTLRHDSDEVSSLFSAAELPDPNLKLPSIPYRTTPKYERLQDT